MLARLAITVSDDTVLRFVKLMPVAQEEDPVRCLGLDDWAWRKGQDYGTILVDLNRHAVVDLLSDRSSETLAEWLAKHPTVTVISRDRSGTYADGAQMGAPGAQQVADRFHLLLNLSAAIERALEERSRELQIPPEEANREQGMEDVQPKLTRQQRYSKNIVSAGWSFMRKSGSFIRKEVLKEQLLKRSKSKGKPYDAGFGRVNFLNAK